MSTCFLSPVASELSEIFQALVDYLSRLSTFAHQSPISICSVSALYLFDQFTFACRDSRKTSWLWLYNSYEDRFLLR